MSEFTDYTIYQTRAAGLEALRAEVAEVAPPGTVIFPVAAEAGQTPDKAAARLTGAPVWVALLTAEAGFEIAAAPPAARLASVLVLEDFASWRIAARCDGQAPVTLHFGGPDGYAEGWFRANEPAFAGLTTALTTAELASLQGCFGLPAAQLAPHLAHDRVWDFLQAIDAPAMQMADQGLTALDDFPADLPIAFAWELWPEIYD